MLELYKSKQKNVVAAYEKWLLSGTENNPCCFAMYIIGLGVLISLDHPKKVFPDVAKAEVDKKVADYYELCNQNR